MTPSSSKPQLKILPQGGPLKAFLKNLTQFDFALPRAASHLCLAIAAFALVGCNAMDFADPPSGDTQTLAYARACFDQGNYTCAAKYYAKLSSASSDKGASETAFMQLSQNGADVAFFMKALQEVGAGSPGKLVTYLSNNLGKSNNATQTNRLAFLHAYQVSATINDSKTKGLVQLVTALILISEILAENASTKGALLKKDLVTNPAVCAAASYNNATLLTLAACSAPDSKLRAGSSITNLDTATDSQFSGNTTLFMLNAAVVSVNSGLQSLQSTGGLGSSTSDFVTKILTAVATTLTNSAFPDAPLYRLILIQQGIGN